METESLYTRYQRKKNGPEMGIKSTARCVTMVTKVAECYLNQEKASIRSPVTTKNIWYENIRKKITHTHICTYGMEN